MPDKERSPQGAPVCDSPLETDSLFLAFGGSLTRREKIINLMLIFLLLHKMSYTVSHLPFFNQTSMSKEAKKNKKYHHSSRI